MPQLVMGKTTLEYAIRASVRAKRITITVENDQVRVTRPQGASEREVKEFVETKKEWIFNLIKAYRDHLTAMRCKEYQDGEQYPYRGQPYPVRIKTHPGPKGMIGLRGKTIWLQLPETTPSAEWPEILENYLVAWYRHQARQLFQEKLEQFARKMGVKFNGLRIKDQKTRWGSCSSKGNINLSWRAIMAPDQVIDYLIIHELAHLRHMNHSPEFWGLVEKHLPDYKEQRKWLHEHARELNLVLKRIEA